jgi:hypothetical protein
MSRRWLLLALGVAVMACGESAAPTTSTATSTTVAPVTTTAAASTTTVALAEPPWAAAPLGQGQVPSVLVEQWGRAENRETCAALAPLGGVEGATPRGANFAGGWAVAWDAPDGPGMRADGTFCEDCGRSAVGVAGTGTAVEESLIRSWPDVIEWSDGSLSGYGNEGQMSDLPVTDPVTAGAVSPTKLAYLAVAGQECLYNVWSRRGEAELLDLIERLRFVEGLGGAP